MPRAEPRIQITVDDELAAARQAEDDAIQVLMEIADGTRDGYDFRVAADLHARRGDRLP